MKLEDQVVSLELAKKLKEAGYKQKGLWWWYEHKQRGKDDDFSECLVLDNEPDYTMHPREDWNKYVAPTVAELGERLPEAVEINNYICSLMINPCKGGWAVYYSSYNGKEGYSITADTEADARAKMWLYLKKEGLL
jgi:hypothetical protein